MLSGARKFGDPVRLLSDAITYASNAASIIIRTPKDEQVLIVGMLYTGSHGLLTKVTSFTHMNYDRILKSGIDSKAVMLSHMASSGQRITVTGADGWQGAGPFMGDGQSFLNVLNMHLDRYMDSGIHDDTR
ncbi:MAG: hypothetical protein L6Q71_10890, partial [Planctomycetes bacterium]|nr:hypothetical protein [Planctomycetota bacterium]